MFPYLEKYSWTGHSQGMWSFHDRIRTEIKDLRKLIENKSFDNVLDSLIIVFNSLTNLSEVEKGRLFPNALDLLNEEDWESMKDGDKEIGWMFEKDPTP